MGDDILEEKNTQNLIKKRTNYSDAFLDRKILAIQKSTRPVFRSIFLQKLFERIRLKFQWYYRWRIDPLYIYDNIEDQMDAIQKSTRTTLRFLQPLHEEIRLHSEWYYKWHIRPVSHKIHWATLSAFIFLMVLGILSAVGAPPYQPAKAAYACTTTGYNGEISWVDSSIWTNCNGGTPDIGDSATISDGDIVYLEYEATISSLTIDSGGELSLYGSTLTVSGDVTILTVMDASYSTLKVGGNFSMVNGFQYGQILNTNFAGSTVEFTSSSAGKTIDFGGVDAENLIFSGSGGWSLSSNQTIDGGLTISSADADLDINGKNFTVTGTVSNVGTLKMQGDETVSLTNDTDSGIIEYSATSGDRKIKQWTYNHLKINGSGGTFRLPSVATTTLNGSLNVAVGTFNTKDASSGGTDRNISVAGSVSIVGTMVANASTITVSGSWDHSTGTFTYNTSTIIMTGTGTFNTGGNSKPIYKLQITGADKTITLSARTTLGTGGILTVGSSTGAKVTIAGGQQIDLQSASTPPITFVGTYNAESGGGYNIDATTISYFLNGDHLIPGGIYGGLYIRGQGSANRTATLAGHLTTSGMLEIHHTGSYTTTVNTDAVNNYNITVNGTFYLASATTSRYAVLTCNSSTLDFKNDVNIRASDASGETKFDAGSATIYARRDWNNADVFDAGTSSVHFMYIYGANRTITTNNNAFYDVEFDHDGAPASYKYIVSGSLDVNHDLLLTDGQLDLATNDPAVTIGGDLTVSADGVWTKQNNSPVSTVSFDGGGYSDITDSTANKQNLGKVVVSDASLRLGSNIKCDIFQLDAEVRLEGYTLEIANVGATADVLIVNSNIFDSSGTIKFSATNSSGNINVPGVNYWGNLQFSGAETYELNGDIIYYYVDDVTIDNGATLDTSASDYGINLKGNWTNNGTFAANSGTVTFSGTASGKTIKTNASAFNTLTINGSGGAWTMQDDLSTVTLNVTAGTFATGALDLTVAGTATLNGGNLTGGAGNMSFSNGGGGGLTISNAGSIFTASATVNIDDSDGYVRSAGTANWTANSATLNLMTWTYFDLPADTYYNLVLNGDITTYSLVGDTTINGNLNLDNQYLGEELAVSTYTLTVGGNITITSAGILSATSGTINVGGNWTNGGTYTADTSEVIFTGTGTSIISGDNDFYDLTMDTDTDGAKQINFTANSTQTIENTWTLDGASGKVLTLRSTSNDTEWYFTIPSSFTSGDFIDVRDSHSTDTNLIIAGDDCTDSDNNDGWVFNQAPVNDSLTFSNPYSSNIAIADNTTEWQLQAKVTDADGPTDIDYVMLRMANSTDSTMPYDSIRLKWTESTDTFSEDADTQDAITLTSTGTDSSSSGNQWTLNFKIKIDNDFLATDTAYAVELYAIDEATVSDLDNYADKYQVKELSLSMDVDEDNINLGNLLPGFASFGTTIATVTTNYPNGYALSVQDNVIDNDSLLLHADEETRIIDYAGTIDTPTSWDGTGLGICLYSATDKDEDKWGAGTTELDLSNKYAGIPETTTQIHAKTGSPTSSDVSKIGYKLMVPDSQKTGTYSGKITVTATGVLN